LHLSHL